MTITSNSNGVITISPSVSPSVSPSASPSSSPSSTPRRLAVRRMGAKAVNDMKGINGTNGRSSSSGDLRGKVMAAMKVSVEAKKASSSASSRRRSADNASTSVIGNIMNNTAAVAARKKNTNMKPQAANLGGKAANGKKTKKAAKTEKSLAGFAAWSAARLSSAETATTTTTATSKSVKPVAHAYMPTVRAPVWQPAVSMLSLVNQAAVSPRLPVAVNTNTTDMDMTNMSSPLASSMLPPMTFNLASPLSSTTATPPCTPCPPRSFDVFTPSTSLSSVPSTPTPTSTSAPVVHDDFEIECTHVSSRATTHVKVTPVQVSAPVCVTEVINTPAIVSAVDAGRQYLVGTPAIRTLIMAMLAILALLCVVYGRNISSVAAVVSVPAVMLMSLIHRSSLSPFDNSNNNTNAASVDKNTISSSRQDSSSPPSSSSSLLSMSDSDAHRSLLS